jgi:hypothetical protein
MAVTLTAGAQANLTVTVQPGLEAVQGTTSRAAIEGYAGGQLIVAVARDVAPPNQIERAISRGDEKTALESP